MKNPKDKQSNIVEKVINFVDDSRFLYGIDWMQGLVAKVLSLVMVFIIIVSLGDLIAVTWTKFKTQPELVGHQTLFYLFGLFLDVLIALEILENITAYLRKHIVQMELVIVTSLVAVARKIIIFDIKKAGGFDLIGLAIAILALSISYLIIKTTNRKE
jgi:uncharacterized membrane protein (DUF373 family)